MILGFSYFTPFSGEMPENTAAREHGIFARAKALLQSRNESECVEIISTANLILESLPIQELQLQKLERLALNLDSETESLTDDLRTHDFPDDDDESAWLCWASNRIALSDFSSLPALAWHEVFAALAIALLNIAAEEELLETQGRPRQDIDAIGEWRILLKLCYWIQSAERAITYAQALQWGMQQQVPSQLHSDALEQGIALGLSNRARIAALQRHAPTNKAILALTRYYYEGKFNSLSDAVRGFCEQEPESVRHLAPTNRHRTLREGLSKQLRARRVPS